MAGEQPKISVIIPSHNGLRWLGQAVQSILAQSFRDFEIIIIDDGSDPRLADNFNVGQDPRIRCFRQEHQGASSARNKGIKMARGEYVTFLDDDDLYLPEKLAKQFEIMEKSRECSMSYTQALVIDEAGQIIKGREWRGDFSGNIYPQMLFIKNSFITTPAVMLRKDIFDQVGSFCTNMDICEDLDLWRRVARISPILHIREALVMVRQKSAGLMGKATIIDRVSARRDYYEKALSDDPGLTKKFKAKLFTEMYGFYAASALSAKQYRLAASLVSKMLRYSPAGSILFCLRLFIWKLRQFTKYCLRKSLSDSNYDKVMNRWRRFKKS
jgi:glycosyltransferase involved in cell wall biosynthesis